MKKLVILGIFLVLVLAGGALTSYMLANNATIPVPVLTTTMEPDASTTTMLGWKAEQLIILVGFLMINLVGIAVTIAFLMWFADRGIRRTRAAEAREAAEAKAASGSTS